MVAAAFQSQPVVPFIQATPLRVTASTFRLHVTIENSRAYRVVVPVRSQSRFLTQREIPLMKATQGLRAPAECRDPCRKRSCFLFPEDLSLTVRESVLSAP
jgi:hypothetical protein